jgi:hypothetical protein
MIPIIYEPVTWEMVELAIKEEVLIGLRPYDEPVPTDYCKVCKRVEYN